MSKGTSPTWPQLIQRIIIKTSSALKELFLILVKMVNSDKFIDDLIASKSTSVEGFWQVVHMMVNYLYNHPNPIVRADMLRLEEDAKQIRQTQKNEYGTSQNGGKNKLAGIRHLGVMPEPIAISIKRLYDGEMPISEKEFTRGFFKRYPKFATAEKI